MKNKPIVGVLVTALLEDDYNKTAHIRPMAQKVADKIGTIIKQYAEVVCPPLVEEEHQAEAAARMFNSAGVDLIVAVEVAYTKGAGAHTLLPGHNRPGFGLEYPADRIPAGGCRFRPDHAQLGHGRRSGDDLRLAADETAVLDGHIQDG